MFKEVNNIQPQTVGSRGQKSQFPEYKPGSFSSKWALPREKTYFFRSRVWKLVVKEYSWNYELLYLQNSNKIKIKKMWIIGPREKKKQK